MKIIFYNEKTKKQLNLDLIDNTYNYIQERLATFFQEYIIDNILSYLTQIILSDYTLIIQAWKMNDHIKIVFNIDALKRLKINVKVVDKGKKIDLIETLSLLVMIDNNIYINDWMLEEVNIGNYDKGIALYLKQ